MPATLEETPQRFPRDMGCFGCSATNPNALGLRFSRRGDEIVCRYAIPDRFHGAPEVAHGGIVATIFDEVSCGAVVFLKQSYVVTGELNVRYEAPCPVEKEVEFVGRIAEDTHPKYAVVTCEARLDGQVIARSTGRFFYADIEVPVP